MATTFTNLTRAQKEDMVVEAARSILPLFNLFSISLDKGSLIKNNVYKVQLSTDPTIGNKTLGSTSTSTGALTGVDVTADTVKEGTWRAVEGEIDGPSFPSFWKAQMSGAVYGCAKAVIDAALGLVTATNYGNTAADKLVVAPADFGWSDFAELETKADIKIKRPIGMLLNAYYAGAIRAEATIMQYAATLGQGLLASGAVPTINGITPVKYTGLPTNSENLGGLVFGRGAIAGVVGAYDPINQAGDGDIVDRFPVVEPNSGLTMLYTETASGGGTRTGEVAVMFGVAKGNTDIVRLLSA
jgi:hypothetical protein